jgi:uncharacterized protein (TIGR02147 family)
MSSPSPAKSIYEYDSYRMFLKDAFEAAKVADSRISFRYLARLGGLRSASFLKHVMDGERNLSAESIEKVAKAFRLNRDEASFFRKLVLHNQSTTAEERHRHATEIFRSKIYNEIFPLKETQYEFFSKWYFVPIRELLTMPGFSDDARWIAQKIQPPISVAQAEEALKTLRDLGLLKRDSGGKLTAASVTVATSDEVLSGSLAQCHRELIARGLEAIDRFARDQRDISSVTVRMNAKTIQKIKEKLAAFRKEIVALALAEKNPDTVFQLNLQLFPFTATGSDGGQEP